MEYGLVILPYTQYMFNMNIFYVLAFTKIAFDISREKKRKKNQTLFAIRHQIFMNIVLFFIYVFHLYFTKRIPFWSWCFFGFCLTYVQIRTDSTFWKGIKPFFEKEKKWKNNVILLLNSDFDYFAEKKTAYDQL